VLFVTKGKDEEFSEGFKYAVELAKLLRGGIMVLLYYDRDYFSKFEDEMVAVSFAEVGEPELAKEYLKEYEKYIKADAMKKINILKGSVEEEIIIDFRVSNGKFTTAIKDILEDYPFIDIVILNPSLTTKERIGGIKIKQLINRISRPVVTMSKLVKIGLKQG